VYNEKLRPLEFVLIGYLSNKQAVVRVIKALYGEDQVKWTEKAIRESITCLRHLLHNERVSAQQLSNSGHMSEVAHHIWAGANAPKVLQSGALKTSSIDLVPMVGHLLIEQASLDAALAKLAAGASGAPSTASSVKADTDRPKGRGGGRPAKWNWEAILTEISGVVHEQDLPNTQADMVGQMQEWCVNQYGDHPSDTEMKKRISKVFRRIRSGGN